MVGVACHEQSIPDTELVGSRTSELSKPSNSVRDVKFENLVSQALRLGRMLRHS